MLAPDPIWLFIDKLEQAGIPYIVTGSVASIFYGEPRLTHDVDLVLHLDDNSIGQMERIFPLADFYCPPSDVIRIEAARRPYGHFNLIHHGSGFKADIYLEGQDPLHKWALENRKRIQLTDRQSLWLAPPEYLIIRKLEFHRLGGSDKHLSDIRGMLPQVGKTLDDDFLRQELAARGLEELWLRAQGI